MSVMHNKHKCTKPQRIISRVNRTKMSKAYRNYSATKSVLSVGRGLLGHHRWFHNHFPPFFCVLHCPLGHGELQACPFPDVVFPPLLLSVLSSSPFHYALQDGFGQNWWMGDMSIPLQFTSFYDGQVFVWSDCSLDLGTDFLVGNLVFVWDA